MCHPPTTRKIKTAFGSSAQAAMMGIIGLESWTPFFVEFSAMQNPFWQMIEIAEQLIADERSHARDKHDPLHVGRWHKWVTTVVSPMTMYADDAFCMAVAEGWDADKLKWKLDAIGLFLQELHDWREDFEAGHAFLGGSMAELERRIERLQQAVDALRPVAEWLDDELPMAGRGDNVKAAGVPAREIEKVAKTASLRYWAVGLEHGNTWWLFRSVKSRWEPSKIDIQVGKPSGVAKLLSENGGACTRTAAAKLWPSAERKNTKTTQAVNKLRKSIQQRIRDAGKYQDVPDPLPWDEAYAGWNSAVASGYAIKDDSGRLTFKTHDTLTANEGIDAAVARQPAN